MYEDGKEKYGVVYQPIGNNLYIGIKGGGAFKNGKKIECNDKNILSGVIAWSSHKGYKESKEFVEKKATYLNSDNEVWRKSSSVLEICMLAEKKIDKYISSNISIWDIAAAKIILEESGGKIYNLDGSDFKWISNEEICMEAFSTIR